MHPGDNLPKLAATPSASDILELPGPNQGQRRSLTFGWPHLSFLNRTGGAFFLRSAGNTLLVLPLLLFRQPEQLTALSDQVFCADRVDVRPSALS